MTITLQLWMLIPGALVIAGVVMIGIAGKQSGMLGGLFEGLLGAALLAGAALFLLGRLLA